MRISACFFLLNTTKIVPLFITLTVFCVMLKEMTFQIRKEDNLVNGKIHSSVLSVSESDLIGILLIDLFATMHFFFLVGSFVNTK